MELHAHQVFGASANQAARARQFASSVVSGWGDHCPDLELVVGELAANAVVHAHSGFGVSLTRANHHILIEVTDASPELPASRKPSPELSGGRGLVIVDRVCTSWGSRRETGGGKTVWAEMDTT